MTFDELNDRSRESRRFATVLNRVRERMFDGTAKGKSWSRERVLATLCERIGWTLEEGKRAPYDACRVYMATAVKPAVVQRNLIVPLEMGDLVLSREMRAAMERVNGTPRQVSMSSRVRPSYEG